MPRHSLTVGVARTDITPPPGFRMQGAMRRTKGASGIESPLLAMPGEPFVEIGLEAKRRSSAAATLFAGYCNGLVAYWPTPQTLKQGGMAAAFAVKTYNNSAPPEVDAVQRIVGGFEQVLSNLELRI